MEHKGVSEPINSTYSSCSEAPPIFLLHVLHFVFFFWKDRKVFPGNFKLPLRYTVCSRRWDLEVCPPSSTRFTISGDLKAPRHSRRSKPDQEFMSNPQHGVLVLLLKCELDFLVNGPFFFPNPPTACCSVHVNTSANLFVLICMETQYLDEASAHLASNVCRD